jgi:hypothetical protein
MVGDKLTLMLGAVSATSITTYPVNGQKNVPVEWKDDEEPDPLRMHNARRPVVGTILSLAVYRTDIKIVDAVEARLLDGDGNLVSCWVNTPKNDDAIENAIFLIPQKPLRPGTTYKATIIALTNRQERIERVWRFTTEPPPAKTPAPVTKTPQKTSPKA